MATLAELIAAAAAPETAPAGGIGDLDARLAYDSGAVTVGDATQRVILIDGLTASLDAVLPDKGDAYEEYPGMLVDSVQLAPRKGGLGRMTITLISVATVSEEVPAEALRTRIEIDMAQIEKPLLTHPALHASGDYMADHLAAWMEEDDAALKRGWKFRAEDGTETELTTEEIKWARKIKQGVESYLVFAPVVTRVTVYGGRPTAQRCGLIETPPASVDGFDSYLKTADRVAQNDDKTWTRTETWTGADAWDTDIYTEAEA